MSKVKAKFSSSKKMIITLEMNETENKNRKTENSVGQKLSGFFFLINKTGQSLDTLIMRNGRKHQLAKSAVEEGMSLLASQKWEEL